jgi:hypothetical protein
MANLLEEPLGDGTIQIVVLDDEGENPDLERTALFTCRRKDLDLSVEQLEAVAASCLRVAAKMRSR